MSSSMLVILNLYYGRHFIYLEISLREQRNIAATSTTGELSTGTLEDDAQDPCQKVDCGQGKCVVSSASLLGFDCLCRPGWSKMQLGPITFPACSIPNCTINYQCGTGAPVPPLPSANPQSFNLFNPCNFVWCGDGTCVAKGLGYYCKCNNEAANLFNLSGVACLKECYIGADCKGVTFGPPLSPPPPPGKAFGLPPSFSPQPKNGISSPQSKNGIVYNRIHHCSDMNSSNTRVLSDLFDSTKLISETTTQNSIKFEFFEVSCSSPFVIILL